MTAPSAAHVIAKGRVQGVGFRYFVQETAERLGLKGWVRNMPNGDVEAEAVGDLLAIETWLDALRKGPTMARVEALQVDWRPLDDQYVGFQIKA